MTTKQLIEAVKNIPIVAEQEQWVLTFDKEEGSLFYSPEKISDNAQLHQVTDEYALYLDENFKPQGVMIEYFKENFLKHHKSFSNLCKELLSNNKEEVIVLDPKETKDDKGLAFTALLETTLIKEAGMKLIPA